MLLYTNIINWILTMSYWSTCYLYSIDEELRLRGLKSYAQGQRIGQSVSSVAQLCPTLCYPMNRSTPGLPVHHQLPEFRLTSIESVIPPSHLILCRPLLLLPPIPPSISLFQWVNSSHECPKYWSFSFSIIPSKEIPGLISFRMTGWISLQSKGLSRVFSNTTVQKHQFFGAQPSSQSNSHIHTWPQEKPYLD